MKVYFLVLLVLLSLNFLKAQTAEDSLGIINTVLDYAEGFYSGDAGRMERAISPDLNKAKPGKISQTGRTVLTYSTYSGLIEATRSGAGKLDELKRKISVYVLNINENVANAKLISARFNDYVQLVKTGGRWKIINVLWTNGLDSPDRTKDFIPDQENSSIIKAAEDYIRGIYTGDAKRLECTVHPEYSKVTFVKAKDSENIAFRKQKYSSLIENSYARLSMVDEQKWMVNVKVVDAMEDLAVAEIFTGSNFEYVQMFKDGGKWKIVNTVVMNNPKSSFYTSVPAIVGMPMPDFTLSVFGGGNFSLSEKKGKNVLLIFPRGWIGNVWCKICQYSYVELCEKEKLENLRKKYNLEIAFVLPYGSEKIADFINTIPAALEGMEKFKNPGKDASAWQMEMADVVKKIFPQKYGWKQEDISTTLPILVDEERIVSKRLKLFTTHWDQINSEQNIPTIFLIDKNGIVTFKYHSQTTFDRPDWKYIESTLKDTF